MIEVLITCLGVNDVNKFRPLYDYTYYTPRANFVTREIYRKQFVIQYSV